MKKKMGLFDFWKGVRYRIRIFDNNIHIMSAEVPDKGQRYITVTIHKEKMGFGENIRLAFMINPDIKPKIFDGSVMEVDYDVRDAVQLGDLLDVVPDLVYEINAKYKEKNQPKIEPGEIIDADYSIDDLTDPIPEEKQDLEPEEEEEERAIDKVIEVAKETVSAAQTIAATRIGPEERKQDAIRKTLALCAKHPKLLYWLPKYMEVEPEIHALVSQSLIYRCGLMPSYYLTQTGAMISEKVLARPNEKQDIYGVLLILGVLGLVVVLVLGAIWLMRGG